VIGDDKWHHVAIVNKGEAAIMTTLGETNNN